MSDYDSPSPPEIANNLPVLYSFRRCPYAMRARMALLYAGQNCVVREVDLKHKPESMLQASAKGTVPVMLVESSVIDESLDVMLWALRQHDPDNWLLDGKMQPGVKELLATNDGTFKEHLDGYKYAGRDGQATAERHRQQAEDFLCELETLLAQESVIHGRRASPRLTCFRPFQSCIAGDQGDQHKVGHGDAIKRFARREFSDAHNQPDKNSGSNQTHQQARWCCRGQTP